MIGGATPGVAVSSGDGVGGVGCGGVATGTVVSGAPDGASSSGEIGGTGVAMEALGTGAGATG